MAKRRAVTRQAAAKVGQAEALERNDALSDAIRSSKSSIADRLWASVADKPVPNAKPATMMRDLYGKAAGSRGAGRPDTAAAAAGIGVSRRTVQKWIRDGMPAPGRSAKADRLRAQWAASPAARKRQISPARRAQMLPPAGSTIAVRGTFVVSGTDKSSNAVRTVNIHSFDPEQRKKMIDSLVAGDEEAAYDAFVAGLNTDFSGDVDVAVTDINWDGEHRW